MSRSTKKGIVKSRRKGRKRSAMYWRQVRKSANQAVRTCQEWERLEIPNPKTVVGDWDYVELISDYEYTFKYYRSNYYTREDWEEDLKKARRK